MGIVGNHLIYKFDRQPANEPLHRKFGAMAEWSCRGLQILVRRFDSGSRLHVKCSPAKAELALVLLFQTTVHELSVFLTCSVEVP